MKIVQTPVRFYPYIGGVENYVYNLSKNLVKMGHEVKVICANEVGGRMKNEKNSGVEIIEGIKVERLKYIGKIANTNITPSLLIKLLKEDFDIIHAHLPTPWSADWSAVVSKIKNRPIVLTYYNDIVGKGFARYISKIYNRIPLKLLLKIATKIIIIQPKYVERSPYLRKYRDKVKVIPVGVDTARFKPLNLKKEENTLFFLSILDEFHRYKGLDTLLRALVKVKSEIPDVKLWVGGSGTLMEYYREMAKGLGLEKNVEFLGFIPDGRLVEYYNRCSAFVLPSTNPEQEGFGIVLLEAMACGTPVITTDIVGVADDIMGVRAGEVVEPGDIDSLSEAIVKMLKNAELANIGKNGKKLVEEKYSWDKIANEMLKVYEECLAL